MRRLSADTSLRKYIFGFVLGLGCSAIFATETFSIYPFAQSEENQSQNAETYGANSAVDLARGNLAGRGLTFEVPPILADNPSRIDAKINEERLSAKEPSEIPARLEAHNNNLLLNPDDVTTHKDNSLPKAIGDALIDPEAIEYSNAPGERRNVGAPGYDPESTADTLYPDEVAPVNIGDDFLWPEEA